MPPLVTHRCCEPERSVRHDIARTALLVALATSAVGCGDTLRPPPRDDQLESIRRLATLGEPCGASFRVVTWEENEVLDARYQWHIQSDTVDICETWVGGDYRLAVQTVGTSERHGGVYDMARDGVYNSGTLYVAEQGSVIQAQQAGSTLFDTFNADAAQVQASYDDPYYGIASEDGCPPNCQLGISGADQAVVASARQSVDTLFRRHGIVRRGVRALVESMDDIGLSPEGYRRFRTVDAAGERVVLVDPVRQLLMGEDFRNDKVELTARHEWTPASFGVARSRTVIETRARGGGRPLLQRTTLMISNVHLAPR